MKKMIKTIEDVAGKAYSENFSEWAFGPDYQSFQDTESYANSWNNLHGDKYKINLENDIGSDLLEMYRLWCEVIDTKDFT